MVQYIELYGRDGYLGQFDLPEIVTGDGGNQFRLLYGLRGGGNGIVFAADRAGARVGVKFLRQRDPIRLDRFANEIRILSRLNHPRIARFMDSGKVVVAVKTTVHEVPWMAMDLGGPSLWDV